MKYETFERVVVAKVKKIVGRSGKVQLQNVRKLNNIVRRGIYIERDGHTLSPTIYLDKFYEMLKGGKDIDFIIQRILEVYVGALPKSKVDMQFFKDFEQVKHQIVYRLINRERNKDILADIPHVDYLNLAICFYYICQHPEAREGAILIHNSHLEMWNIGAEMLMPLANSNTPQLFPAHLCTVSEALVEMGEPLSEEQLKEIQQLQRDKGVYMYELSNSKRSYGAAAILYPGILADAAKRMGGNFHVIPSSIHETLLLYDEGKRDSADLNMLIEEINRSRLDNDSVLSDYAYLYDVSLGRLIEMH